MLLRNRKIIFCIYGNKGYIRNVRRTQAVVRTGKDQYTTPHPLTGRPVAVVRDVTSKPVKFWACIVCK